MFTKYLGHYEITSYSGCASVAVSSSGMNWRDQRSDSGEIRGQTNGGSDGVRGDVVSLVGWLVGRVLRRLRYGVSLRSSISGSQVTVDDYRNPEEIDSLTAFSSSCAVFASGCCEVKRRSSVIFVAEDSTDSCEEEFVSLRS